ncbi:hypothetical protein GBF38_012369 [Nibea albiflora]|uniref:Uncharacterized protein n=1 Tax=Nibea albiflora TaxID=240163 RepID=A0ACB7EIH8_NIBAL|nr:hypothetical protein GBF38_012369 [Nibea albiflora]
MENRARRKDNNSNRCQNWVEKLPRLITDQAMDPQYARTSYQRKLDKLKTGVDQLEKIEEEMAELRDSLIELRQVFWWKETQ